MDMRRDSLTSIGYLTNLAGRLLVRALERRLGSAAGPMPVFLALVDGKALAQKDLARLAAVEQPTMAIRPTGAARCCASRASASSGPRAPSPPPVRSTCWRCRRSSRPSARPSSTCCNG